MVPNQFMLKLIKKAQKKLSKMETSCPNSFLSEISFTSKTPKSHSPSYQAIDVQFVFSLGENLGIFQCKVEVPVTPKLN